MSHKNTPKPRGRPRAFDERTVLKTARDAFWEKGLAHASLDAIAEKTGVARPSLAAAFGDKSDLYLRAVGVFVSDMLEASRKLLSGEKPLREELTAFLEAGMQIHLSGGTGPRGCLAICTMPVEALENEAVREGLKSVLDGIDEVLTQRFEHARRTRELSANIDARAHAQAAGALLHSLAIRARARTPKRELKTMIAAGVDLLAAK